MSTCEKNKGEHKIKTKESINGTCSIAATEVMELTLTRAPKILILSVSMGVLAMRILAFLIFFS